MKAILAVAVLAMVAFAGVMIVGDDTDAETYAVTIEDPNGGDIDDTTTPGTVSGTVEYGIIDGVKGYFLTITITSGAGAHVTYVDYFEQIQSVAANDAGKVIITIQIDEDTESFAYAVTATAQTSMVGLATNTIAIDVTLGEVPPSTLTWSVDGIVIGTAKTNDISIPDAPSKEHYALAGWAVDNSVVITYNAGLVKDGDQGYRLAADPSDPAKIAIYLGDLKEDTTFAAVFEPVNHIITLMVGGDSVGKITAPYGSTVVEPKLPEGYVAWCTVATGEDGSEVWTAFAFDKAIDKDYTLVAKPKAVSAFDITFKLFEGKADVIQKSDSMVIPDTTREGYLFQGWVIQGGTEYVDPAEYVKTVTENTVFVAVYKLATGIEYNVTFELYGDKDPVTQKANSMTVPDTTRVGFDFMGWVVKGSSDYVDPVEYVKTVTADVTFVAVYKAVEVVKYTATFINGDDVTTVEVIAGELVNAPEAPEGMFWLYDADAPVTADMTVYAKPLTVTVQFAVEGKVYNAYTQTIAYGEKIDVTKLADFIFPAGYDSWNYDFNEPVTADMTVFAKAIPEPEKEPRFYETPMGQCAIVIVVFLVGLLGYGLATGKVALPKVKLSVKKNEEVKKP